jgi:hypothetical protein
MARGHREGESAPLTLGQALALPFDRRFPPLEPRMALIGRNDASLRPPFTRIPPPRQYPGG